MPLLAPAVRPRLVFAAGLAWTSLIWAPALRAEPAPAFGSPPAVDGAALYKQRCASCHDRDEPTSQAPPRATLARRPSAGVVRAMTSGPMQAMAQGLGPDEIAAIATYITGQPPSKAEAELADRNPCKAPPAPLALSGPQGRAGEWMGWGRDLSNARYQPAPGIAAADAPRLKLKWAFVYPGGVNSQPTVVGGRAFVASYAGRIYALDAKSGCVLWRRDEAAGVRSALAIGPLAGPDDPRASGKPARLAAFYGDSSAVAHAVDAATGAPIWSTKVDTHPRALITGSPVLWRGRLYVPVSSLEEGVSSAKGYGCCTFRGSVAALDARTGRLLWQSWPIQEKPAPTRVNAAGVQMYGPAGGAVWSAPTVDPKRGVLYVGSGDSYTDAPSAGSDAVVAMDLVTGQIRWSRQATQNDNFLVGCNGAIGQPANCPTPVGPDHDFGTSPILARLPGGRQVLLAGQKSGVVWALDPDHEGAVLWQAKVGYGGPLGGIEWGMAADAGAVYAELGSAAVDAEGEQDVGAGGAEADIAGVLVEHAAGDGGAGAVDAPAPGLARLVDRVEAGGGHVHVPDHLAGLGVVGAQAPVQRAGEDHAGDGGDRGGKAVGAAAAQPGGACAGTLAVGRRRRRRPQRLAVGDGQGGEARPAPVPRRADV
jgi:polyvinyl alcohol dehydrogenase (cytochrome)